MSPMMRCDCVRGTFAGCAWWFWSILGDPNCKILFGWFTYNRLKYVMTHSRIQADFVDDYDYIVRSHSWFPTPLVFSQHRMLFQSLKFSAFSPDFLIFTQIKTVQLLHIAFKAYRSPLLVPGHSPWCSPLHVHRSVLQYHLLSKTRRSDSQILGVIPFRPIPKAEAVDRYVFWSSIKLSFLALLTGMSSSSDFFCCSGRFIALLCLGKLLRQSSPS